MAEKAPDIKKYSEIDIYKLIGVEHTADASEIKKAYRKTALKCHPDKNPDDARAAEKFQELQDAYLILSDVSARAAYDRIQRAKREAELRNKQLDSKRQKLKRDLEDREKEAKSNLANKTPEEIFKLEFERIMKENKRIIEEENEAIKQQIWRDRQAAQHHQQQSSSSWDSSKHRIRIKWKAASNDPDNGGYSKENLTKFLYKYGDLVALIISSKKNGSAMVEFKRQDAAEMAVQYERGLMENPLKLDWVDGAPKSKKAGATVTDKDYESLVLMQLRQAEERKRLIEQMQQQEDGDDD